MDSRTVLNIASGKFITSISAEDNDFVVNLDPMYPEEICGNVGELVKTIISWYKTPSLVCSGKLFLNLNAIEFMEKYPIKFDIISIYRYMEHIPRSQLLYFIYLLSTTVKMGGIIDVIVPNYLLLSKQLIEFEEKLTNNYQELSWDQFENADIISTTEFLNEPYCPHASIWTPSRMKLYFEAEKRFTVEQIAEQIKFDGRDIYMRAIIRRID